MGGVSDASSAATLRAIQGTKDDLWVLLSSGTLLHGTGGALQKAPSLSAGSADLVMADDLVVVADTFRIQWCRGSSCIVASPLAGMTDLGSQGSLGVLLCARAGQVAAIAVNSRSSAFVWSGTTFVPLGEVGPQVNTDHNPSCWIDAQGRVNVPQQGGFSVISNGATRFETVADAGELLGGADLDGESWLVGATGAVYRRGPTGWVALKMPIDDARFYAVVGLPSGERYVFGDDPSDRSPLAYRVDGSEITPVSGLPQLAPGARFRRALITGPDEFYVAGSSDRGPFVVRATR